MTYWLKPIGTQENNVLESSNQGYRYEVHFQKEQRPSGVQIGDVLILYAVGHKYLIGWCEVISRIFESSQAEQMQEPWRTRFPYGVYAENRSIDFSANWIGYGLNPQALGEIYHEATGQPLTRPGREHLNAIEWGKSHIALADDFARYLMAEMDKTATFK